MSFSNKGTSLLSMLIGGAILLGASISAMKLGVHVLQVGDRANTRLDLSELKFNIRSILEDEADCKVSLAGEGPFDGDPITPIYYSKTDVDGKENFGVIDQGIDVELWKADKKGEKRLIKRVSSTDSPYNKFSKILIKELKLFLSNGTENYEPSNKHFDVAELRVKIEYDSKAKVKTEKILSYPVTLELRTNASKKTAIIACTRKRVNERPVYSGCPNNNTWYCACDQATAPNSLPMPLFSKVRFCFYCNTYGAIDSTFGGVVGFSEVSGVCNKTKSAMNGSPVWSPINLPPHIP